MAKKDEILKELTIISKKHKGMLRPADVVEFAKGKNTALHNQFTWDNTKAAEQWRLHEARMLIRVSVTVLSGGDDTIYRAFVSLKNDRYNHRGYRPLISVLSKRTLREALLEESLMEMEIFKDKFQSLTELIAVFAEMDKVIGREKEVHGPGGTLQRKAATA